MKTVKLKFSALVGDKHRKEGEVIAVTDGQAVQMIAAKQAEYDDGPPSPRLDDNPARIPGVVDPLVNDADPLHAARALSLNVPDHPGLVAHAESGVPGAPKRVGRVVLDPEVATPTPLDPAKQPPKPKA